MKNRIYQVGVASLVVLFSTVAMAFPWKFVPSQSGDYCRDELEQLLQKKFGENVKVTDAKGLGSGEQWVMWATSNACSGYIAASFMGEKWTCKQGVYGKRPHTLIAAYGHSGTCKDMIPKNIHW